jgi:hypothetical protein
MSLEGRERLCNDLLQGFRCHFLGVLVAVLVFARYCAGPQSHLGDFRLLFAKAQAQPATVLTVISAVNRSVRSKQGKSRLWKKEE